jgi:hypothetical protein
MGLFNMIDKLVEPITKDIFPPEENWFEAPNYVEFQRRRYNSALTGMSYFFKAVMVFFVIYVTINLLSGENQNTGEHSIEKPALTLAEEFSNLHFFSERDKFWDKLSDSEKAELRRSLGQ